MTQLNSKILAAPILAIALALFLAGATSSFLPVTPGQHSMPEPTKAITVPTPQANAATTSDAALVPFFIVGAILVGIAAMLLLFREKDLAKTLSE